ncbi:hypothetical protein B0H21DRAFT_761736, partial [Amylocystis lapponica]
ICVMFGALTGPPASRVGGSEPDASAERNQEFICSATNGGAFLVLNEPALRVDQHPSLALHDWIRRYYILVPAFARQCGMGPSGTIVIIESCTFASQCATGVFVVNSPNTTISFHGSFAEAEDAFSVTGAEGTTTCAVYSSQAGRSIENPDTAPAPSEASNHTLCIFARVCSVTGRLEDAESTSDVGRVETPVRAGYDPIRPVIDYIFKAGIIPNDISMWLEMKRPRINVDGIYGQLVLQRSNCRSRCCSVPSLLSSFCRGRH